MFNGQPDSAHHCLSGKSGCGTRKYSLATGTIVQLYCCKELIRHWCVRACLPQAYALAHWYFHKHVKPTIKERQKTRANFGSPRNLSIIEEDSFDEMDDENEYETDSSRPTHWGDISESSTFGDSVDMDDTNARYHLTFEASPAAEGIAPSSPTASMAVPLMSVEQLSIFANLEYMANWSLAHDSSASCRQGFALALLQSSVHYLDQVACPRTASKPQSQQAPQEVASNTLSKPQASGKVNVKGSKTTTTSSATAQVVVENSDTTDITATASRAPNTLATTSTGREEILLEGPLWKRGRVSGLWQQRSFRLTNNALLLVHDHALVVLFCDVT